MSVVEMIIRVIVCLDCGREVRMRIVGAGSELISEYRIESGDVKKSSSTYEYSPIYRESGSLVRGADSLPTSTITKGGLYINLVCSTTRFASHIYRFLQRNS
mgnify:CR=1 FL=1